MSQTVRLQSQGVCVSYRTWRFHPFEVQANDSQLSQILRLQGHVDALLHTQLLSDPG